jgi:hypothetical protein
MSDPVTNVDIEDVLSSIRRLVREGGGPPSHQSLTAPQPSAPLPRTPSHLTGDAAKFSSPPPGRFMLTPALRVAEPIPEPQSLSTADEDILPQTGSDDDTASDPSATGPDVSDFLPEEPAFTTGTDDLEPRLRASDRAAGLEVAVTARTEEWEPDGSEDVPVMDWAQTIAEDAPIFRSRQAHVTRPDLQPAVQDIDRITAPFRHDPVEVSAVDPALLPDDDIDRIAWHADGSDPALRDDFATAPGNTEMIDAVALRALIVQIVQEELQGSLGERITRNVRKLVRREINRMIVSDDLD